LGSFSTSFDFSFSSYPLLSYKVWSFFPLYSTSSSCLLPPTSCLLSPPPPVSSIPESLPVSCSILDKKNHLLTSPASHSCSPASSSSSIPQIIHLPHPFGAWMRGRILFLALSLFWGDECPLKRGDFLKDAILWTKAILRLFPPIPASPSSCSHHPLRPLLAPLLAPCLVGFLLLFVSGPRI